MPTLTTVRPSRRWVTQICSWVRSFPVAGGPVGFDFDGGGFAGGVVVEAAPTVVFGFVDEASGDRITVDVLDLLFEFSCGEDVEVVVARLPEVAVGSFEEFGGLAFDDSEGGGEVFWFAEEEMEVFGHQDVGVEEEVVGAAGAFDCLFEDFFGFGGVEVGKAVVTTEGDEVEMT
jgi:hypothetical protein